MKKILFIALLITVFLIIETLLVSIFTMAFNIGLIDDIRIEESVKFLLGISWFRTAIYFIPQLLLTYLGMKILKYDLNGFRLSLINLSSFVLITTFLLVFITNDLKEFLRKPITYYFIIATFVSPLIATKIPFLRSLIEKI